MPGKSLVLAGCFEDPINTTAWCIIRDGIPQPNSLLTCNAEETDTRLWLHCKQSTSDNILILSPDTDIYHIGLPLNHGTKYIMIRINTYNSKDLCFLHLSSLINALNCDPDLSSVESSLLPQIHQTLFVVTGCDYILFFRGIGKATFMRYFFQHSEFITSGKGNTMGTLAKVSVQNKEYEEGFISFLCLVGVVYMKKHISGFNGKTPEAYFNIVYTSVFTQYIQRCFQSQCCSNCTEGLHFSTFHYTQQIIVFYVKTLDFIWCLQWKMHAIKVVNYFSPSGKFFFLNNFSEFSMYMYNTS